MEAVRSGYRKGTLKVGNVVCTCWTLGTVAWKAASGAITRACRLRSASLRDNLKGSWAGLNNYRKTPNLCASPWNQISCKEGGALRCVLLLPNLTLTVEVWMKPNEGG
nr:MAG: hypothetical protein [Botourmiaviridae sp.]WAK77921.1 MAG: hypothetical protein [Botourmiaviridae sp.]WAK77923.1 MAG: hypothetical protein [Botourmiaviridae sp.]